MYYGYILRKSTVSCFQAFTPSCIVYTPLKSVYRVLLKVPCIHRLVDNAIMLFSYL